MWKFEYMLDIHFEMTSMGYPYLHQFPKDERDSLELLNFYIEDCLWEFIEHKGNLSSESIVRLHNNRRELAQMCKRLNGKLDGYFENLLLLSKYVLRRFKIKEAQLIVKRDAERAVES